jgi:DNA-binding response OmpR family regulator
VRVLLVEDEVKLAVSLKRQLDRAGYTVEMLNDGQQACDAQISSQYALVILDLNLPGKDGLDVLRALRARADSTPVLILSARDSVKDRVRGLRLGADDYLIKPFDSAELLARIERVLARSGRSRGPVVQAADLKLDIIARKAFRGGKEIPLTARTFALLEFMLRNKNQVLTRRRIAEQVLGLRFDPGTNIIDFHICNLRKAIDEGFTPKLIYTLHGEGFMLKET